MGGGRDNTGAAIYRRVNGKYMRIAPYKGTRGTNELIQKVASDFGNLNINDYVIGGKYRVTTKKIAEIDKLLEEYRKHGDEDGGFYKRGIEYYTKEKERLEKEAHDIEIGLRSAQERENKGIIQGYIEATRIQSRDAVLALDRYLKENPKIREQLGKDFKELRKQILHTSVDEIGKLKARTDIEEVYSKNGAIEIAYKNGTIVQITKDGVRRIPQAESRPRLIETKAPEKLTTEQQKLIKDIQSIKGLGMGDFMYSSMGSIERRLLSQLKKLSQSTGYDRIDEKRFRSDADVMSLNRELSRWLGVPLGSF